MKSIGKIVGYNLLAILVYSLLIRIVVKGESMGILVFSAFAVGLHVIASLFVAVAHFSDSNRAYGRAWLLSALVVLLVGFSTCLGNAAL